MKSHNEILAFADRVEAMQDVLVKMLSQPKHAGRFASPPKPRNCAGCGAPGRGVTCDYCGGPR